MIKNFLMWSLLAITINPPVYPQSLIYVPELFVVDHEIIGFMKQWQLPAGSIAIIKDGRLVYARAFGESDNGVPASPDNLYRIASLSKPITAMGILKLVQEEQLSLDDHVFGANGILNDPEFSNIKDDRVKDISIKHLLKHTAGWNRNTSSEGDPMFNPIRIARQMKVPPPADPNTIIQYLLTKKLDFTPGSSFSYSNVGYSILGRVIEKITGVTYEEYIKEALLYPLGISSMSLGCNIYESKQPDEVRYYGYPDQMVSSVCEAGKMKTIPYGGFNLEAMDAHGGWIASASDLAKLLVATHGYGTDRDLFTPEIINKMMTPSEVNSHYGLGWFINEQDNRWHTGSLPGSSAMMADISNGIGWVMLFNGNPQSSEYFSSLDKLMWKTIRQVSEWPKHDLFELPSNNGHRADEIKADNALPDLL